MYVNNCQISCPFKSYLILAVCRIIYSVPLYYLLAQKIKTVRFKF